jgi:hypothetical protein
MRKFYNGGKELIMADDVLKEYENNYNAAPRLCAG